MSEPNPGGQMPDTEPHRPTGHRRAADRAGRPTAAASCPAGSPPAARQPGQPSSRRRSVTPSSAGPSPLATSPARGRSPGSSRLRRRAVGGGLRPRRRRNSSLVSPGRRPTRSPTSSSGLDLPGDQRQNLGRSSPTSRALPTSRRSTPKLDEALDRLVGKASGGKRDYIDGDQAVVRRPGRRVGVRPAHGGRRPRRTRPRTSHGLLVVSEKDPACRDRLAQVAVADLDAPTDVQERDPDASIRVVGPTTPPPPTAGGPARRRPRSVKAASTAKRQAPAWTTNERLRAPRDRSAATGSPSLHRRRAMKAYAAATAAGIGAGIAGAPRPVPAWVDGAALRAESDRARRRRRAPRRSSPARPRLVDQPRRASSPDAARPTTLAFAEAHDAGQLLQHQLDLQLEAARWAAAFKQIDQAARSARRPRRARRLGRRRRRSSSPPTAPRPAAARRSSPTDVARRPRSSTQLKNLVGTGRRPAGITIRDEPYGGGDDHDRSTSATSARWPSPAPPCRACRSAAASRSRTRSRTGS